MVIPLAHPRLHNRYVIYHDTARFICYFAELDYSAFEFLTEFDVGLLVDQVP